MNVLSLLWVLLAVPIVSTELSGPLLLCFSGSGHFDGTQEGTYDFCCKAGMNTETLGYSCVGYGTPITLYFVPESQCSFGSLTEHNYSCPWFSVSFPSGDFAVTVAAIADTVWAGGLFWEPSIPLYAFNINASSSEA